MNTDTLAGHCKHCSSPLTTDDHGMLVDGTGGDVCGIASLEPNENRPHELTTKGNGMKYTPHTVTLDGWTFQRVSSEYIDVFPLGSDTAVACINVFDYEAGEPRIKNTKSAVRSEAREWRRANRDHLGDYRSLAR